MEEYDKSNDLYKGLKALGYAYVNNVLIPDFVTKTHILQLLCMWIINNWQKMVLMPDCVTKICNLQLLYKKGKCFQ